MTRQRLLKTDTKRLVKVHSNATTAHCGPDEPHTSPKGLDCTLVPNQKGSPKHVAMQQRRIADVNVPKPKDLGLKTAVTVLRSASPRLVLCSCFSLHRDW